MGNIFLANLRAVWLVSVCCMGSFLFAYDTGVIGGVLTLPSFKADFGYSSAQQTSVNANAVSVLQGGAFFGCFFIWPIASRFGRRIALVVASIFFELGSILQVINSHSLPCFYVGRVISGLGVGAATTMVPIFAAEMSPKEIRGVLGSFFQLFFAFGVLVSYWVGYAVSVDQPPNASRQWQIAIGLQLVPGALVGIGMFFIRESARWLARVGRNEEALQSLIWVRGGTLTPAIKAEYAEILAGIEYEIRATDGLTLKELWLSANRFRIFIAVTLQLAQQLTGNTSLAYYAPQIFNAVGAGNSSLFITGFFGVVKVVAVSTFVAFVVGRIGRKTAFMGGSTVMAICMFIIAALVATHPPSKTATGINSYGRAAIAMVYLEAFTYNWSWGPVAWVYIGEIFPNRIREIGVASGAASQWLFNFMMSQVTPYAIANIGWRTFLMFGIFNVAIAVYSFWILKETAGRSLEEMETVFNSAAAFDVEATRQKALNSAGDEIEAGPGPENDTIEIAGDQSSK